jgi:hypothetical protein
MRELCLDVVCDMEGLMRYRTSTYTIGSSLADEVVEENGRTYHVYKDGSKFSDDFEGMSTDD